MKKPREEVADERSPRRVDVLVVGAGPAGAVCARRLAAAGVRVALVDRAVWPRYKTCGGGLVGRTLSQLDLDLGDVIEDRCHRAALGLRDVERNVELEFETERDSPIVAMAMRSRFDAALVDAARQAGADFHDDHAIESIDMSARDAAHTVIARARAGSQRVPVTVAATMVVAADGALSPVSRAMGLRDGRTLVPALEFELDVSTTTLNRFAGVARFDFGVVPHGYGWVFPKSDHLSAGILSVQRGQRGLERAFDAYMGTLDIELRSGADDARASGTEGTGTRGTETRDTGTGGSGAERHGFLIPISPRRDIAGAQVLACGDAAGFADPVTAEGISFAVRSGDLAARAILDGALDPQRVAPLYRRLVAQHLTHELRAARFAARLLYDWSPMRAHLFTRHGRRLCEVMTDVIAGTRSYSELVRSPASYARLAEGWLRGTRSGSSAHRSDA